MAEEYDSDVEVELDLSDSDVVTKYKAAAEIVNRTLQGVIQQCVAGKPVSEICQFGDTVIESQCAGIFKSKKIEKGIAFPTCISVNEVVCHNSPLDSESTALNAGDWVKIDLGCHIDGFIAVAAHTIVVMAEAAPITGPAADLLAAAHVASEALQRVIRPGATNAEVTETVNRICQTYGVKACQGVLMHQMKRFVIDGNKVAIQRQEPDQNVDAATFAQNEVYAVDLVLSTGEGKPRECEARTTVFKRAVEENYRLKMKASRYVINEVNKRFPTLPFSLRALDERQGRMGVI